MHVVTGWLGHSTDIALKHYCQITEDHFKKAVQNPVQQAHAEVRTGSQGENDAQAKSGPAQADATICNILQGQEADGLGFEPRVRFHVQ